MTQPRDIPAREIEALRRDPPIWWDAWIAEGLQHARRAEAQGYPREAERIRAYIDRRTSTPADPREPCARVRCTHAALPGSRWCHRCAPTFASEAAALLAGRAA